MSDSPPPAPPSTAPEWMSVSAHRSTVERIRRLKHEGDSWDSLLRKMSEQYDPDEGLKRADR